MRLFVAILCIVCTPAFTQDLSAEQIHRDLRLRVQALRIRVMALAISRHQPILLPQGFRSQHPLPGTNVTITATDIKGDDGEILQLGGTDVRTGGVVMQADELPTTGPPTGLN